MRSYGWTTSGTIVEDEAAVIRDIARQLDDGTPLRAVARSLNEAGVTTVRGKSWASLTVKRMVVAPRMVGDVDGWPPILERDQWERIREDLTSPERAKFTQTGGRSWISGLVRCGRCGGAMYAQTGIDMKCSGTPPDGGEPCRSTTIRREFVEAECAARLVARLSDVKVRRALARKARDRDGLRASMAAAEERSQVLASEYGAGVLSTDAFTAGARAARSVMTDAAEDLRVAELDAYLPGVDEVVAWWEEAPVDRRREVADVLLAAVVVAPKSAGVADRLTFEWR